jgi:putative sugar O-methyltransferase
MSRLEDDPETFDEMLEDMREAPDEYRPTNFWSAYHDESCRIIREQGVGQFRSHHAPIWASFGAVADPLLGHAKPLLGEGKGLKPAALRSAKKLVRRLPGLREFVITFEKLTEAYENQLKMLLELSYHYCFNADPEGRLTRVGDSGAGSPHIQMKIGERIYTLHFLRYFLQYLYLCRFVDFDTILGIVEIGGGYGGMAEVILKLHPHIVYVDVDIPPQIYIAERYLSACFEGRVQGYLESKKQEEVVPESCEGKQVFTLCPWQLPALRGNFDLFINSASFQEMEPSVVENYARHLDRLVSTYGYIRAMPLGAYLAPRQGVRGVLERTTLDHYRKFFHRFELVDDRPAEILPNLTGTLDAYRDFLFEKREG